MTPARLVTLVCVAQVCAQIGAYTWPALLPGFIADWHITNGEAGWITGLFYAAYTVSVPVLVTLTDRVDPRAVYLTGVGLTIASHAGFAAIAWLTVFLWAPPQKGRERVASDGALFDFRPVLRNRSAMAYAVAY